MELQFKSRKENSNEEVNVNLKEAITVTPSIDGLNISKKSNLTEQGQII